MYVRTYGEDNGDFKVFKVIIKDERIYLENAFGLTTLGTLNCYVRPILFTEAQQWYEDYKYLMRPSMYSKHKPR